jgi:hypothetical protein
MKRVAALIVAAVVAGGVSAGVAVGHAGTAGAARIYHQESSIQVMHTAHGYTVVKQSK